MGWFENSENTIEETNGANSQESDKELDVSETEKIIEKINFNQTSTVNINPAKVTNGEFGFQLTLSDVDKWEFVESSIVMKYKNSILPNKFETFKVKEKDLVFFLGKDIFEIVIYKPNDLSRDENIRKIIQIYNYYKIHTIESELDSDVDGIWYVYDACGLAQENCKYKGWIQLIQKDDMLLLLHVRAANDADESIPAEINEEIVSMLNSFRMI